jgi:hypothetical protein
VRAGRHLQRGLDHARVDDGGAGLGVDRVDPVQVPAGVDDDAGADRVAGDRGARPAHRQRYAELPAHRQRRDHLVGVPRPDDGARQHAVQRPVGGVQRPGQARVVDVPDAGVA